jgi:pyruvate/2-oxoglutarate dehydrogenase complex dihydrolipoamide dehydrogenase (E3) component
LHGKLLDTTKLPEHLVIIGGGYIGLEMSQFYRRMGSRVTVIKAFSFAKLPCLAVTVSESPCAYV